MEWWIEKSANAMKGEWLERKTRIFQEESES